jgi:ribosomal protein S6--L-glutamate ligase
MLAESRAAAESILDTMWGLQNTVIVQECLPAATREDKRAFVLGGRVIAAMRRTAAKGEFRSNVHRGGEGHKTELDSDEERLAAKAATLLGLEIAGVDIAHCDTGPVILEVNASPGIEGLEKATGVDAAGEIIRHIERLFEERKTGCHASRDCQSGIG